MKETRVNVLVITGSLSTGGTELYVQRLVNLMQQRGRFAPYLCILGSGGQKAEDLREAGIQVTELGISGPIRRPANLRRLLRIPGLVRRNAVSIIHTFLFDADFYGMLAALAGRPSVTITTRRALKWKKPHHIRGYRFTNRLVDRIVANSEKVRKFTIERERVDPAKVIVIPNGVDPELYLRGDGAAARKRLNLGDDQTVIGVVGTVKEVKGQMDLLEAVHPLLREDSSLRIVLAGRVAPVYGDSIKALLHEWGMEGQVILPGIVRNIPDLLAALDFFVLPSHSEGMSNALLEAMASGKAIVATDVGGNAACLGDGTAGIIVPPSDPARLRQALATLLGDEALCREYSRKASVRVREEYSLERNICETEYLYESLLAGSRHLQ